MKNDSSAGKESTEGVIIESDPTPPSSRPRGALVGRILWGDGLFLLLASLFLAFLILFLLTLLLHGAWIRSLGVLPDGDSPKIRNSVQEELRGERSRDRALEAFVHAESRAVGGGGKISRPEPA